jgi:hypothetical protein
MHENRSEGPRRVTFPVGRFISPGIHQFKTERTIFIERWVMGFLVEEVEELKTELFEVEVGDPGEYEDIARGFIIDNRAEFTFENKTFTVVRDSDLNFWGGQTKAEWLEDLQNRNKIFIEAGRIMEWWDVSPEGNPQRPAQKFSISAMAAENKTLMAHLMVELGFFPSVGQARKNGWDKPLELGRHELGPKKKRAFVEIVE